MKAYKQFAINWNYKKIQDRVGTAYLGIQESWRQYDPSYTGEYLGEELAAERRMKIRNEESVQKNVRLLSAVLAYAHDKPGEQQDKIWYLIYGSMIGYCRNWDTVEIVKGKPGVEAFYEYWLPVHRDDKWVLWIDINDLAGSGYERKERDMY